MNAVRMNIEWKEADESVGFTAALAWSEVPIPSAPEPTMARQLSKPVEFRCPQCDSIIYSRRNKLCGVCSQPLPEEFLFSQNEAERLEKMLETEKRRHKQWMSRVFKSAVAIS